MARLVPAIYESDSRAMLGFVYLMTTGRMASSTSA